MIEPYLTEVRAPFLPLAYGSTDSGVVRVQEWLSLHGFATAIDGEFGPATRAAVTAFQHANPIARSGRDGEVDVATWGALIAPLINAEALPSIAEDFGDTVCRFAWAHLSAKAREAGGDNRGPFVRHYCRGHSVAWCQGFVSTMWLDAARFMQLNATPIRLDEDGLVSLYVPWVVESAKRAGKFIPGADKGLIPAGSMFFVPGQRGGEHSHIHVGIVTLDDGVTVGTIEGNTNHAGGSNGYEVAARFRRKSALDFGLCT